MDERSQASGAGGTDPKVQQRSHKWLRIMDTFAEGINRIVPDEDQEFFNSLPEELRKNVKVALIDDGVNIWQKSITERIKDGWSFDTGYDESDPPEAMRPFHESATGHGTLMANMICRVCPRAEIFVYRMNVYSGDDSRSHFTPQSAADVSRGPMSLSSQR